MTNSTKRDIAAAYEHFLCTFRKAESLKEAKSFPAALITYKESLDLIEDIVPNSPDHALVHTQMGCIYVILRELSTAEDQYKLALRIHLESEMSKPIHIATALMNLGHTQIELEDMDAATTHLETALGLFDHILQDTNDNEEETNEDRSLARLLRTATIDDLDRLYSTIGSVDKQAKLQLRYLRTESTPIEEATHIITRIGQAVTLKQTGKADEALRAFCQALHLIEEFSPGIPEHANVLDEVGVLLMQNYGHLEDAENAFQEAREIREELGLTKELAVSFNNLALLKIEMGDFHEAVPLLENAVDIWENDRDESNLAIVYVNLASVLFGVKDYDKAQEAVRKASNLRCYMSHSFNLLCRLLTVESQELSLCRKDLGGAREKLEEALEIRRKELPNSLPLADGIMSLATFLMNESNECQQAKELFLEALDVLGENGFEESSLMYAAENALLSCLEQLGEYDEAIRRNSEMLDKYKEGSVTFNRIKDEIERLQAKTMVQV